MTTGKWSDEPGYNSHGGDNPFLFDNREESRYARSLIRFDLENQLPQGATVTRAVLEIYASWSTNFNILESAEAAKPWTDGETWWYNWGHSGTDSAFVSDGPLLRGKVAEQGSHHFNLNTSVVQKWIEISQKNYGLLTKTVSGDKNFHWNGNSDKNKLPPKLIVEYDLP